MPSSLTNGPGFAPYFSSRRIFLETEPALMAQFFNLRYQIYCEECQFLPANNYPDHQESDEYDAHAVHFGAFNLKGEIAGYVRLVRPEAHQLFPFQLHCPNLMPGITLSAPGDSAEVSRLMVHPNYRRRRGDQLSGVNTGQQAALLSQELRNNSPQILLSLYRQIYNFSRFNHINYWYAAMEQDLAQVLNHLDFQFEQIGLKANYFGPVAPYLADLRATQTKVGEKNPALLAWMQETT
jgi:N-acyl amino acid synthase of PEP-CTERM/exosortase system